MSQECPANQYCAPDGTIIDLTQAGVWFGGIGGGPGAFQHARVEQAQTQAAADSSSINWAILAPAIVGAVLAIVLFVAVAIYVKRTKVTSRSSSTSAAEPQLEGVTVETASPSSPVVETRTAEAPTTLPQTSTIAVESRA